MSTLGIVLIVVAIANLIPCLIYLDYRRRLRQLQQRRSSDFNREIKSIVEDLVDEESQGANPIEEDVDKIWIAKDVSRVFVSEEESLVSTESSCRRYNRHGDYDSISTTPPLIAPEIY